ncbi:MAG: AAA family ATPase, partial [Candidatus Thorarchaeota archaeon]
MVHIKTIKMTGFKSFGNSKTVIDLAPGFTCIVGPNGSGKSNAIDAINFCLGTLSKKSMRAEKLTDLLFNGSKGKDPAQSAIVEIELDNKDLKIPVKEETVFISRELKRNGSGVYRLNGKKTTRTDILDKLRIAGIDCVDGFNIIQQGQIGEIVGMSSIQRRELLEGVAGIGQFEDKKEAAIAELDEAQRKMGELNLLINELSARVNQLKREKEAAEKWVKLGEIIKRLRSEFLSYKLSTIEREVDTLSNEVKDQNRMIAELENNKQGLSKLKELEDDIKTNQAKVEELEQKRNMTSEGLNNAKIDLVRLEQLLEFNKTNIEQKNQEIQNIDRDKILATSSIDERQIEIQKISKQLQRLNNQKEDLVQKRTQIEIDIQDRESEFQETQEEMSKIAKQLQDLKEDISTREVSQEISASIVQGFQESKSVTNDQILEIKRVLEATKTKIMSSQEGIDRDTSKLKELQEKIGIYEENLL